MTKHSAYMALLLCTAMSSCAHSSSVVSTRDILTKCIQSAEQYRIQPPETTYWINKAEYIGTCSTSANQVTVAQLSYARNSDVYPGEIGRQQAYIVFYDKDFMVRDYWRIDQYYNNIDLRGTTLFYGEEAILDFQHPPRTDSVILDGKPQTTQTWQNGITSR